MISTLIVSEHIHFIEKLVNIFGNEGLSVNINHISENVEDAIGFLLVHHSDMVIVDSRVKGARNEFLEESHKDYLLILKEDELFKEETLTKLRNLVDSKDFNLKREFVVNELTELGYDLKYSGTHYLADSILTLYKRKDRKPANLQGSVYPIVGKQYNKKANNIKASINRATDFMYAECNIEKLKDYFHFSADTKPTIKQVVFAVVERV
ncbi:MAG: hypothetical protein HFJ54_04530 [Clostridia bacterium]|nr:hypothetical protein [Clostridia bacterium]